jgi:Fe2+ transport system protein FeoA
VQTDSITLYNARRGSRGTIRSLPENSELRSQCIRLGMNIGASFHCVERLPGGTIVLEINRQEIALGKSLAVEIGVTLA